jgi:hypothetical protein
MATKRIDSDFTIGTNWKKIQDVWVGQGKEAPNNVPTVPVHISGTDGGAGDNQSATDINKNGTSLFVHGGRSTGTGTGGSLFLGVGSNGTITGSSKNALITSIEIKPDGSVIVLKKSSCRAYLNTEATVLNNGEDIIVFDEVEHDVLDEYNETSGMATIVNTDKYFIHAKIKVKELASGVITGYIAIYNGVTKIVNKNFNVTGASGDQIIEIDIQTFNKIITASDQIFVVISPSATIIIDTGAANTFLEFGTS